MVERKMSKIKWRINLIKLVIPYLPKIIVHSVWDKDFKEKNFWIPLRNKRKILVGKFVDKLRKIKTKVFFQLKWMFLMEIEEREKWRKAHPKPNHIEIVLMKLGKDYYNRKDLPLVDKILALIGFASLVMSVCLQIFVIAYCIYWCL